MTARQVKLLVSTCIVLEFVSLGWSLLLAFRGNWLTIIPTGCTLAFAYSSIKFCFVEVDCEPEKKHGAR